MDKSILDFLVNLNQHNNREWFQQNKAWYEEAKRKVEHFVDTKIIPQLAFDNPKLEAVTAKQCMFRIYRDIRFSKNKLPYKTAWGVFIGPEGRKSPAGYYLHIEPGKSFAGGGAYRPEVPVLKAIRNEIYFHPGILKELTTKPEFVRLFGNIKGEKLKRPPKGFPADFAEVDLLKLKDFTVIHSMPDSIILSNDFDKQVIEIFRQMKELNDFIYRAIENME